MGFNLFKRKKTEVVIPRGLALLLAFVIAGMFAVQLGWSVFIYLSSSNDTLMGPSASLGFYLLIEIVPPAAYFTVAYLFHPKPVEQRRRVFISLLIAFVATTVALMLTSPIMQIVVMLTRATALSSPTAGAIINSVLIAIFAAIIWWLRHTKRWK
jgi:hypothetical protein